jgi:hypothetical protein
MRTLPAIGLLLCVCGCAGQLGYPPIGYPPIVCPSAAPCQTGPVPAAVGASNPIHVANANYEFVWETAVDVMDDYFKIEREEPIRLIGSTLTEGQLETFPEGSPIVLEPWRRDAAGGQRIENTLQSMRRRAVMRVIPGPDGYWINLAVYKELEDMAQPEHATAASATFRYDDSLRRVVNPVDEQQIVEGWIPQGRDVPLEQKILGHLQGRLQGGR